MIRYDAVVVGTGFGGSVVGTRLAQSGMRVLFLERGPWWGPAAADLAPSAGRALPRGAWGSRKLLRNLRHAGRRRSVDVRVNLDGLYEIHRFPNLTVLGASGVGGGSHVYAAIQREPNADYWDAFPPELTGAELAPYFARVRDMQHPTSISPLPIRRPLNAAAATGAMTMEPPQLAIDHTRCVRCSRCVLGCPHGAKTTLDLTYLPAARAAGAELWPMCEVQRMWRAAGGFVVEFVDHRTRTRATVQAERLILAAGTMNTVRLLFDARDRLRTLPGISARLGRGFSGNGDYPLVLASARRNTPSSGVLVNTAAHTADAYYLDADIPLLPRGLQLLAGMADDGSPARLRAVKGGLSTDADKHLSKSVYQRMDAELLAARQAGHLRALPAPRRLLSAHPLGGAAMADSAATGVVAHTGEAFGEPRLYVSDGAVLPRAPGVPPSLTIAALAERTADLVIQEARP